MSLKPNTPTAAFEDVICLKATDKALLVLIDGDEHWIAKSQVDDDSEVFDDDEHKDGRLVVSEWIARERGLVK